MDIRLQWLGQAGFLIQTERGTRIAIDPYLSDSCQRQVGFKRMIPAPVVPEDFSADYLLISHEHQDHLDTDLFALVQHRKDMKIFVNPGCMRVLAENNLSAENVQTVEAGQQAWLGEVEVRFLRADHGDAAPDALGFLLDIDGRTIYFAGDTALTPELLAPAIAAKPDIALLPINGMYGNLDGKDAAELAGMLQCGTVIPCHYWMFVEHGACPYEFKVAMEQYPDIQVCFMAVGEEITL